MNHPTRNRLVRLAIAGIMALALLGPFIVLGDEAEATHVSAAAAKYQSCGRVFPDPHAFWPAPSQSSGRSPWAKGAGACTSTDFLQYQEMVDGSSFLEKLFPDFVEFYNLERDFGDGSNCATSTSPQDKCSAGLPRQGSPPGRIRSDLHMVRITDERVPDKDKKFFVFALSIHGIERAGAEGGIRAAEDLATWAYCEAAKAGQAVATPGDGATINCAQEGTIPHPILETQPGSRKALETLSRSAIYFVFANPDGWRRGDVDNISRFYQRYNGNGVDLNRDWPSLGFIYRPYTPWSEPETRSIGRVLKSIRKKWDGGIDLHGQLVDRAFSFTMLAQGQVDYGKNQRILQVVKGAWQDAEQRLGWSPLIIPNNAPQSCQGAVLVTVCDRMYGVQWGTVWDTIDYTTTGAMSDWMNSELGLGADGLGNEMSFSHLSNCGTGTCYDPQIEQLHIDGNKSLIYGMVNFTLEPEDNEFSLPANVGYIFNPKLIQNAGTQSTKPNTEGLSPQAAIMDVTLEPANNYTHQFQLRGPGQGVYNGGLEGKATPLAQLGGISGSSLTTQIVLERYFGPEENPDENPLCGSDGDGWTELNSYYNQGAYLQSGQAVHANDPIPGHYRICLTGDFIRQASPAVSWDLDITFSREQAWDDPGQSAYSVSNMKFFEDLAKYVPAGKLTKVLVDDVLSGKVRLEQFASVVIADDPFPGYNEPKPTGAAQQAVIFEPPDRTAGTTPCFYDPEFGGVYSDSCAAIYEFRVDPAFNNQKLSVLLEYPPGSWSLQVQRRFGENWRTIGYSNSYSGTDLVEINQPEAGLYRAQIINSGGGPQPTKLAISFSNQYTGPPPGESKRSTAELQKWSSTLKSFVQDGGNLVLTDGALKQLAYMNIVPRPSISRSTMYAGFISFTRDGEVDTFKDALSKHLDQPGSAEGDSFRHQTYEPVPVGFEIPEHRDPYRGFAPIWTVEQGEWEKAGGRTVGVTLPGETAYGELPLGKGVIRVIGALVPMPSEDYYHPFGLSNYSVTYSGYQVLSNVLQYSGGRLTLAATGSGDRAGGDLRLWGLVLLVGALILLKLARANRDVSVL